MVEVGSTASIVKDSALVELEGLLVSLNGDRDRANGSSSSQGLLVHLGDIVVARDGNSREHLTGTGQ